MEDKMHSSIAVANKLIQLAKEENKTLTPMKLIKLVFLCHGWMLGLYGRHLIKDSIEAWRYGPVIPNLYSKIKHFRSDPVTLIDEYSEIFTPEEEDLIKQVYHVYGNFDGIQLSALTHEKNSPWDLSWNTRKHIISNDLIENYYKNQAKLSDEKNTQ